MPMIERNKRKKKEKICWNPALFVFLQIIKSASNLSILIRQGWSCHILDFQLKGNIVLKDEQ